jgi:anaerobic magnesium-protoporphyrin IX monomethyl ester cyclase
VIVAEARECVETYQIRNFHFKADTFTWNKDWVLKLCGQINARGLDIKWLCNSRVDTLDRERVAAMKKAGCWAIGLGVESGNQGILDKIKKGITLEAAEKAIKLCREFKLTTYLYFIIGFPWDNKDTVNDTMNFALKVNPDFVDFFFPYPFPGTELEQIARENKLLAARSESKAYSEADMATLFLSKPELSALRKAALRRFYMRPGYILRRLSEVRSLHTLGNYIYYGLKTFRKIG